jgi:glyoxylase-like metal-dependent hydrolase (beta-lactamase superfamily II)
LVVPQNVNKRLENKRRRNLDCFVESAYTVVRPSVVTHHFTAATSGRRFQIVLPAIQLLCVLLLLVVSSFTGRAQSFTSSHFHTEQLAPGVYAAIATDNGFACANAGIVDLGEKTLVFDTFLSPLAAQDLLRAAEHLTRHPVAYVVNSHFHNDHIRGNQVFSPDVQIISTTQTREAIRRIEPDQIKWEIQNAPQLLIDTQESLGDETDPLKRRDLFLQAIYYKAVTDQHCELKTRLPNLTFESKLTIEGTARKVELLHLGSGHTPGDCIMFLPDEHIAFVGDLVSIGMHPYMPDGILEEWKVTLRELEDLSVRTIVPGHGPVGDRVDITTMLDYFQGLQRLASNMVFFEKNDDEIPNEPIPPQYQPWLHRQNFLPNLRFLYSQTNRALGKR